MTPSPFGPPGSRRIGYARVSTHDQRPELQLDALSAAGCEAIYVDRASGVQRDRPELQKALAALQPGDTLVVWKLDRLARSMQHLIETISALEDAGVGFLSLTEAIETGSAGGRLVLHIFAAVAEFERSIIRERTLAGLEAAALRGRKGGRPRRLTPDKLEIAKRMRVETGASVSTIARAMRMDASTLYRALALDGGDDK
jgi:DNA invertase Pin-like site-specific DNA recombinase